jgi:pimeloyl-ACP methyl ester carboxylesterase
MGALVATRLVPAEPRARSLVLGGIGGRVVTARRFLNRGAIADAMLAAPGDRIEDVSARAFRRFAERSGNDLAALAAIHRARGHGARGALGDIAVPTLVIVGEDDALAGPPGALAAEIAGATAVTVPGNHLGAVARPELAAEIVAFLARVSPV